MDSNSEEEFAKVFADDIGDVVADDIDVFYKELRFEDYETSEITKALNKKCDIVFCIDLTSISECFLKDFQKNSTNFLMI